jgi:hypothetical protein
MTDEQVAALLIVENLILESHTNDDINEMVDDDGVKCHLINGELEHVVVEREFFMELQEDDSILVSVDEVCDYGIKSTTPLYLVDPDGEIHEL